MKLQAWGFGGVFLSQDLVIALSGFTSGLCPGKHHFLGPHLSLEQMCEGFGLPNLQIFLTLDSCEGCWAGSNGSPAHTEALCCSKQTFSQCL